MFTTLLETGAAPARSWTGAALSAVVHASAIALAVTATHDIVREREPVQEQRLFFAVPEPVHPPPAAPRTPTAAPPIAKGYQILVAPIHIPDVLPPIDLTAPVTNAADFTGSGGVAGGRADGTPGAAARALDGDVTYFGAQVEKIAAPIPGTGVPAYPERLRDSGVEGRVRVTFVVDTTGRADMQSYRMLESTHPAFADAVRKAVMNARFFAAEVGGRRVRQHVELPFVFSLKDR